MALLYPGHPSTEPERQANEEDVQTWVETGERPKSSKGRQRPKTAVEHGASKKTARKKVVAWEEEPGPLQVVLDMHSSTVEKLNRVTITCEQLQAENDQLLSKLQREDKRIGFEESTIQNLSRTADFLEQALEKIEARMIVVFRTTFDQDDQREMKAMYEKVETRLKQELEELQDRTAKERKLAARVPELLKALDDQKDALDEKASECESLKLDKQVLEEKVRMITKRAEKAEQGREHVLTRESELVEKTKELSAEIAAQRKNIASMQGQLRDFHHAKLELERFKQSSAEASKSLNEAWRENAQLQVQVERGASDLHESQSKVREFQVKLYKEEMESRKIHEQFDSMAKSVKEYREELFQTQRLCDTRVEELQVSLDALNQHVNSQEVETEKVHESLDPVEHRIELLEQAVLHMLQSHKGEQLKNEMQEIQIRMLAEKQREVNSLLQDESAKLASSDAENARLRLQVEKHTKHAEAIMKWTRHATMELDKLPEILGYIEQALSQIEVVSSICRESSDQAMTEVRRNLYEQHQEKVLLQQKVSELTSSLNKAVLQAADSDRSRIVAISERDSFRKTLQKAEHQQKKNDALVMRAAKDMEALDTGLQKVQEATALCESMYIQQREAGMSELEGQLQKKLDASKLENSSKLARITELEAVECELQHVVASLKEQLSKQERKTLETIEKAIDAKAQLADKSNDRKALADCLGNILGATNVYRQCVNDVCESFQVELKRKLLKKKREKSPGKKRSKSPDKGSGSWASYSLRTHENTMGCRRNSFSPGNHVPSARAASASILHQRQRQSLYRARSANQSTRIKSAKRIGAVSDEEMNITMGLSSTSESVQAKNTTNDEEAPRYSCIESPTFGIIDDDEDFDRIEPFGVTRMSAASPSHRPASCILRKTPGSDTCQPTTRASTAYPATRRSAPKSSSSGIKASGKKGQAESNSDDLREQKYRSLDGNEERRPAEVFKAKPRPSSSSRFLESVLLARQKESQPLVRSHWISPAHRPHTAISRANKGFVGGLGSSSKSNAHPEQRRPRTQGSRVPSRFTPATQVGKGDSDSWELGQIQHLWDENRQQFEDQLLLLVGKLPHPEVNVRAPPEPESAQTLSDPGASPFGESSVVSPDSEAPAIVSPDSESPPSLAHAFSSQLLEEMAVHSAHQAEDAIPTRMALANLPTSALPLIAETIPLLSPLSSAYSSNPPPSSRSSEGDTENSVKDFREHVPDGDLVPALDNGDLELSVEGRDGPKKHPARFSELGMGGSEGTEKEAGMLIDASPKRKDVGPTESSTASFVPTTAVAPRRPPSPPPPSPDLPICLQTDVSTSAPMPPPSTPRSAFTWQE